LGENRLGEGRERWRNFNETHVLASVREEEGGMKHGGFKIPKGGGKTGKNGLRTGDFPRGKGGGGIF